MHGQSEVSVKRVDCAFAPDGGWRLGLDTFAIDRLELDRELTQNLPERLRRVVEEVKPEKHKPGRVVHGSMFPDFFGQINGMWLYDMGDNLISYGFVTPLSSEDPNNDPHRAAQEFKRDSPFMRDLLEGAELAYEPLVLLADVRPDPLGRSTHRHPVGPELRPGSL